jgi:myo-inositol catabolism protein IolC
MVRRSWYLRADAASELADVVTDLHFTTRRRRHEILSAMIEVAVGHRSEIEALLTRAGTA